MIHPVTEQNFILQNIDIKSLNLNPSDFLFLFIKARWCGHCVSYLPQYNQYSAKYTDINFLVLESTDNERLLEQWSKLVHPAFSVAGFPTVVMYNHEGVPIKVVTDRFKLDDEISSARA